MAVDGACMDARTKDDELHWAKMEIKELESNYEELERSLCKLEDIIASDHLSRKDKMLSSMKPRASFFLI